MRKIRLELDQLAVESFDTAGGAEKKAGTVRGHDWTWEDLCVISDGSYCATAHEWQGCYRETKTCFASCLMTYGEVPCMKPCG